MELAPLVRSPLRVRRTDGRFVGTDVDGQVVIDGEVAPDDGPELMVWTTAGGTWRVQRRAGAEALVLDTHGHCVARVERHHFGSTDIVLSDGETISVGGGALAMRNTVRIGDLAKVNTPYLFPNRYVTIAFGDQLLSHRQRELVTAIGLHVAWGRIQAKISASSGG